MQNALEQLIIEGLNRCLKEDRSPHDTMAWLSGWLSRDYPGISTVMDEIFLNYRKGDQDD